MIISVYVKKTTKIYKQNPVYNGYFTISELEDVFRIGHCSFNLDYNFLYWFVNDVEKIENNMAFYFRKTKKFIILTEEDEKVLKIKMFVNFVLKKLNDKVRDHCHLTGTNRRTAYGKCSSNVTQKRNVFIPFVLRNFSS